MDHEERREDKRQRQREMERKKKRVRVRERSSRGCMMRYNSRASTEYAHQMLGQSQLHLKRADEGTSRPNSRLSICKRHPLSSAFGCDHYWHIR